ncbi:MAG: AAC(3) family N-acetyltransferase [Anaerolineae bacterium]|nr:AAC(3) family N-acetyltransferase [Anaerolineae bacterium]
MHPSIDLTQALRQLDLDGTRPAIIHASLSSFGYVEGGAPAIVAALLDHFDTLVAPAFTYNTMLTPGIGPPDNAIEYGRAADTNRMSEFFQPNMPVDKLIGLVPETLRRHPQAARSSHPILSFTGVNAAPVLAAQSLAEPLAPIQRLVDMDGWVVLLGVSNRTNTSIHLGERLAGRRTFVRWGLTPQGVRQCPGFPSCSDGFNALDPDLEPVVRIARVAQTIVQAFPLRPLVEITRARVAADPLALLCVRPDCPRCAAVRAAVERQAPIHSAN